MREPSPQEKARLEAIKRSWEQRKQIGQHLATIKRKVAVYSGKGGVGKTTVAVNLAVTLARKGYKTGILDVDIDCPNVVKALHIHDMPTYHDGVITPAEKLGVKVVSMAFFQQNPEEAIIWRGPMIHNAINQFVQTTDWGELDYLLVDLPPGTSDAPLTVMQLLNPDGFIVVTTPQELAILDAKRSINMIRKMNLQIIGILENMAGDIFGSGQGEALAREMGVAFLGRLELRKDYRESAEPAAVSSAKVRKEYESVAEAAIQAMGGLPDTKATR